MEVCWDMHNRHTYANTAEISAVCVLRVNNLVLTQNYANTHIHQRDPTRKMLWKKISFSWNERQGGELEEEKADGEWNTLKHTHTQRLIRQAEHGGIGGCWLTPRPQAASEMLVLCVQARSDSPAVRIKRERERWREMAEEGCQKGRPGVMNHPRQIHSLSTHWSHQPSDRAREPEEVSWICATQMGLVQDTFWTSNTRLQTKMSLKPITDIY